jgi:hypothetical protein
VRLVTDTSWRRRGFTLLWGPRVLAEVCSPGQVRSIRQFSELSHCWAEDLPAEGAKTLVVAGLEGCLDCLRPDDAEGWVEPILKPLILGFQDWYEGQAGLIFWLPGGRQRIRMERATESYHWYCAPPQKDLTIPLGRILWAGAERDAGRILDSREHNLDSDGPAWIGLHHPRIS